MSMTSTTLTRGRVAMGNNKYDDRIFTAAGAGTIKEGTLIALNTTTNKYVVMAVGGADGTATPVAVLGYDIVATGAGDIPFRPILGGDVRKDLLIIAADNNGTNITQAHLESLRSYAIFANANQDLSAYDPT